MNLKSNIAFDIDGVFLDFFSHLDSYIQKNYDDEIARTDSYQIQTKKKMDQYKIKSVIDEATYKFSSIPAFDGAVEFLEKLYYLTKEPILFVTSRPRVFATHTYNQIESICKLPFIVGFADNTDKLRYIPNKDFFVEDRRKTTIEMAKAGKHVFLVNTHYNWFQPNGLGSKITRINGLKDLIPMVNLLVKEY